MKPGGLCSPSDGSNMPSGDAVGAVPSHKPPDSCGQFSKAASSSREGHTCLTPDLYEEHNQVLQPTTSHINGLLSHAGLSNGVYTTPYTSDKRLDLPRHVLSPPQSEDGEDEGPAPCTTSHSTFARNPGSAAGAAASSTFSHPASSTYSLPNVCGKSFKQLTIVTSTQEEKLATTTECKTSDGTSSLCSVGNSMISPRAAFGGYGLTTVSTKGSALTSLRNSKSSKGRRRISLEEMVTKLRTEANRSGNKVVQSFPTSILNHGGIQEKSVDCLHKNISSVSTENNSGMKSSYQSGQSFPHICDNNNTAIIFNVHPSKDSSIKERNSKSDSGNILCGEEPSSALSVRTPETTVNQSLKETDKSQSALPENASVIFPSDCVDKIPESCVAKCSSLGDAGVNVISSLTGNLQECHEETRLKEVGHDVVRTKGSVGSLDVSAGISKDARIESVLNHQCDPGPCISKDCHSRSEQQFNLDSGNVFCDVTLRTVKHVVERHTDSPIEVAAKVMSDNSVIDLTGEPESVRSSSVELIESESVDSRDSESDIEVLYEKGVSTEKSLRSTEKNARTASGSDRPLEELVAPVESTSDNVCSSKGAQRSCDSAQEIDLSKRDDGSCVLTSLVNTDRESVQYLEPISDDENSLLCAPSLSSGLSSVSGFQSNSNTPMFSDTPSDASRGTLMVRISDAVAAILSDVSDESLPASPLASNSSSVDGFQSLLPSEKLSKKIEHICEKLDKECLKSSSVHSVENFKKLQSDVHSERLREDSISDLDKERTASQVDILEMSEPLKDAKSDVVQPTLGCAKVPKPTDLGQDLPSSLSSLETRKDVSCESLLPRKSICEMPSSIISVESVTEKQESESCFPKTNLSELTGVSSEPIHLESKLSISDDYKEFGSSSSVSGFVSAIDSTGQSSFHSASSPDTLVASSSPTQVSLEDLGTVTCVSISNTVGNLCQNPISGSQTISSQTQNCNTLQSERKENAAGLLLKMPSAISLDSPSRSGQSSEHVADDIHHKKVTTLEIHPLPDLVLGEDNSSVKSALKHSCVPHMSSKESSQLSLVPDVESENDSYLHKNSSSILLPDQTLAKPWTRMIDSVDDNMTDVGNLLQAEADELQRTNDTFHSAVAKGHAHVESAAEKNPIPWKEYSAEVPLSLELLEKKTHQYVHSVQEDGFQAAGFPKESSQECPVSLKRHTTVQSSVSLAYTVRDNYCVEEQGENDPNIEVNSLKKTGFSDESISSSASEKVITSVVIRNEPVGKEIFASRSSCEHGDGIRSVPSRKNLFNEYANDDNSLLEPAKEKYCSSKDIVDETESPGNFCDEVNLVQGCIPKVPDALSELTKQCKSLAANTEDSYPSAQFNVKDSTSSTEIPATETDYSAKSTLEEADFSKVPITDVKSSLSISSTTKNSAVSPNLFSTVVPLAKHDSIDQSSYQSPKVEWNTSAPHSQIFTTSDKVSPHNESTSPNVLSPFRNSSEYRRPKSNCHPSGGANEGVTQPMCEGTSVDTEIIVQDTLRENRCPNMDETDYGHSSITKAALEVIRPPLEAVYNSCQPAEVIRETSHLVSAFTVSEKHTSLGVPLEDNMLPPQDRVEASQPQVASTEICQPQAENTEISHPPVVPCEVYQQTTSDIEISPPPVTAASYPPDEVSEGNHDIPDVSEDMRPLLSIAETIHSSVKFNEDSQLQVIASVSNLPPVIDIKSYDPPATASRHQQTFCSNGSHTTVAISESSCPSRVSTGISHLLDTRHTLTAATEVGYPASFVEASNQQVAPDKVSHLPAETVEVSHSPAKTTEVSHPPAEATEVSHLPAKTTEVSHSPAKTTEISHPPAEATEVSHPPAEATEMSHPSTEATEVTYPPTKTTEVTYSPAETTEVTQLPAESTEDTQLLSETSEVIPSSAETIKVTQTPVETTKVSYPPAKTSDVGNQLPEATEVIFSSNDGIKYSHSPSETIDIHRVPTETTFTYSPSETTKVSCITTDTIGVNLLNTETTKVSNLSTDNTKVSHLCSEITEVEHLTTKATEVDHTLSETSEVSHPHTDTTEVIQPLTETSEISHSSPEVSEIGQPSSESPQVSCLASHVTEVSHSPSKTTEASHPSAEATEGYHHPVEDTGFCYPADEAVEVSSPSSETTDYSTVSSKISEVSHPSAETTKIKHLSTETTEVTHSSAETTEVSHSAAAATKFKHLPIKTTELNCPSAEASGVSSLSVEASEISDPLTEAAKVIHPLVETSDIGHTSTEAPEVHHPYAEVNKIMHISLKDTEVIHPLVETTSHQLGGATEISHQLPEATEISHPSSKATEGSHTSTSAKTSEVTHPSLETVEISHPSPEATEISCPSAKAAERNSPSTETIEACCLSAEATEASHPLTKTTEASHPSPETTEVSHQSPESINVSHELAETTRVSHHASVTHDISHSSSEAIEVSCPLNDYSEVSYPSSETPEVSQSSAEASEVSCQFAEYTEVCHPSADDSKSSHLQVTATKFSCFLDETTEVTHTAAETTGVTHTPAETTEVIHPPAETTEITHPPAETTEVTHPPAETTGFSYPSPEAFKGSYLSKNNNEINNSSVGLIEVKYTSETTNVNQSLTEATKVIRPSPETTDINHPRTIAAEVVPPLTENTEINYSSAETTQVSYPSAEITEIGHPPNEDTEVSHRKAETTEIICPLAENNKFSYLYAETVEVSHQSTENVEVSHPSLETAEISNPLTENTEFNYASAESVEGGHPSTENMEVSHPSADIENTKDSYSPAENTEVYHPSNENTEASHLSLETTEVSNPAAENTEVNHIMHNRISEWSHHDFDITNKPRVPAEGISSELTLSVSDISQDITHPVTNTTDKDCHSQEPAQDIGGSSSLLDATENNFNEISEFRHPVDEATPVIESLQDEPSFEVNSIQTEPTPEVTLTPDIDHTSLKNTSEIRYPVAEVSLPEALVTEVKQNKPPADIKHTSAEVSPEGKQHTPEASAEFSPSKNEDTPEIRCPIAEVSNPVVEAASEALHSVAETTAEVSHSPSEATVEVSHPTAETTVEAVARGSHPPTDFTAEIRCTLDEISSEVTHLPHDVFATVNHPPPEAMSKLSHPLPEISTEVTCSPFETHDVSHPLDKPSHENSSLLVDASPGVIHRAVNANSKVGYPAVETNSEASHPAVEVSSEVSSTFEASHSVVESSSEASHATVESSSEASHSSVESNSEANHPTVESSSEVSCPAATFSSEISHQAVNAASDICTPTFKNSSELNHSTIKDSSKLRRLIVDASPEVRTEESHTPFETKSNTIHHDETITEVSEVSLLPVENCARIGQQLLGTPMEANNLHVIATDQVGQQPPETSSEVFEPLGEASASLVTSLDGDVEVNSWTKVSLEFQSKMLETQTVFTTPSEKSIKFGHPCSSLIAGIVSSPVCELDDVAEDGITKYGDTENKEGSLRLQSSDNQTNSNATQDNAVLEEAFDIASGEENNVLFELAPVKEELQQSSEDSVIFSQVEDTSVGTSETMGDITPAITDVSTGGQADLADLMSATSSTHERKEQGLTNASEDKTTEGEYEVEELKVLEKLCPLCCEKLHETLENHVSKHHICHTFVPAKTTWAYQYHMLKRVKDVSEITKPLDTHFSEGNAYVCRSCHFASQDINAVRFHLNTHEDVYQVRLGDKSCKCNQKTYSYPFHKWKTLIHNSSYHCFKCNYYFACEKGFSTHLQAMHFMQNCCNTCKERVPLESMISHFGSHKTEEKTTSSEEALYLQNPSVVTRSSGGNFGISWNIYDNCINFLDGKNFHLNTSSTVSDTNLDRSYLKLPLKNVMEEAVVPDEARIDPGKDIAKYMKGKKNIRPLLDDDNDEVMKNFSFFMQMELLKKVNKKGRKGHGSTSRPKREDNLFDVLGISSLRLRGAPKKEVMNPSSKQNPLKKSKGKAEDETKKDKDTEDPEIPQLLTRTRSGMQSGKGDQEERLEYGKSGPVEPSVVVDGEWSRDHTYICCSCGAGYLDLADIMDHKWEVHPAVWCAHTMIQGQGTVPVSFCKQYQPPTDQPRRLPLPGVSKEQTGSSRRNSGEDIFEAEKRDEKTCTSCKMQFQDVNVFHSHLVECGGLALLSAMKKKSKKGFRFKRRKGQGVPNNRYGNNSQPSTPLKAKSGDRSSGLSTPQNDRASTAPVHSCGVKRRLELAVGSIDNLELKNRLKAIITGSRGSGSNAFRLPGRRTVRMKLRKKALETRRLRKTRHSDRVKENMNNKDEEKKEVVKMVGKSEKDNKSEVEGNQNSEDLQVAKKSGVKKVTLDSFRESKQPNVTTEEEPQNKEKSKKKVKKVTPAARVDGNVTEGEVTKSVGVAVSDNISDSKNGKKKTKLEESDKEVSQTGKKLVIEKKVNGVIDKIKNTKKKKENAGSETQPHKKSSGVKLKQSAVKKVCSKAVKLIPSTKISENYAKQNGIKKTSGPVEKKEGMTKKDKAVTGKQNIGKKNIGTKIKSVLSKSTVVTEKPGAKGDKKPPKKVSDKKRKSVDSESGREGENLDLQLSQGTSKNIMGEKKAKPKKIKDVVLPGSDTNEAEMEKKNSQAKKSTKADQLTKIEVEPNEHEVVSSLKGANNKTQEISKAKETEVKEVLVSHLTKLKKQVYYSSSEDSEDSDDSEPEVIRNFRSGRRCGGRMGLRNKRKPINTRYSFRTCFSSASKEEDDSDLEAEDSKPRKIDYLEKEEEEFSEELPITLKRKRKVANYENQDDYTYVPFESSSDPDDELSDREMDSVAERISWSLRKKRKSTRTKIKMNNSLKDISYDEDSCPEERPEEAELEASVNIKKRKCASLQSVSSDGILQSRTEDEVKIPKRKKNEIGVNIQSEDFEGREDSIENEMIIPKRRKNISSMSLEENEDKIFKKSSKKKKSVKLLDQLMSSDTSQEEGKEKKKKGVRQVQLKVSDESAKENSQEIIVKSQLKDMEFQNIVTEELLEVQETGHKIQKKRRCNSGADLQLDGQPISEKAQEKQNVILQEACSETLQVSVQETSASGLQIGLQVAPVPKKKIVKQTNAMSCTDGEEPQLEIENSVKKLQKKKKAPKSQLKANNIHQHPLDEFMGKISEGSLVSLPSTAKRKKKLSKKISSKVIDSFSQGSGKSKNLSQNVIEEEEEEEDDLPLSTFAQQIHKKKTVLDTKKSAIKPADIPKFKKAILMDKKALPLKNLDLLVKESVAHDSESSSFEGFIPVPSKKAGRNKMISKKPRKKLDLVKAVTEANISSTASESELSDVAKPLKRPKKISVSSHGERNEKGVHMPNLIKSPKAKGINYENIQLNDQSKVKATPQKRTKAKQVLKPSVQQNHMSPEGKITVVKPSKAKSSSFISQTMPVLEPMNIFKPDVGGVSELPESDSNGEGALTSTQKLPAKVKRRRSSVEKIKDIPTRSSVLVQMQESQSPPELKAITDETEEIGLTSLNPECCLPPLKGRPKQPPEPRKRRIKSSQELLLKTKSEGASDSPPDIISTGEVKEAGISISQKRPEKRKRAASTSGVPSKDVHEVVGPVKDVDQPLGNLTDPPKKNLENNKRKKTNNTSKTDINELKCIDCGLKFGSLASLEDHQQDCVTIAFEMSLMEAEDHLFECPHCHLTFALKGTQRKHTTSCRLVKYKRSSNRHDSKSLKRASRNSVSLDTHLPENVVTSSDITIIAGAPPHKALVTSRRRSKENVASDDDMASASPLREGCVTSFSNHSEKIGGDTSECKLKENVKKASNMQRVVPITARGSPRTKKESQVNGRLMNGEFFDFPPAKNDDNQRCSVCGYEVTDKDTSNKHELLQQFTYRCQQQAVLEVCTLVTYYNLGIDAVRSLVSTSMIYQGTTILRLDAKQQETFKINPISTNASSSSAIKLREILSSPHCTRMLSILETIAKHHQTTKTVSISGTRQEALKAVSALEEILKEMSEVDSAIRKNHVLKSMGETFEAGTLN